jgi:hypothetical protein
MQTHYPIETCALPSHSRIIQSAAHADFADCYCFEDPAPHASAMETYLAVVLRTPEWMHRLMRLRNLAVQLVGLKNLGSLNQINPHKAAHAYRVGDRAGIFSVAYLSRNEVVLGEEDKHLEVQLSVVKQERDGRPMVFISTVVHNHNWLGKAYMAVVGPVHQRIVPRLLRHALHAQVA